MKLRTIASVTVLINLSGCLSYGVALPDGYVGPTAVIRDTAATQSGSLAHMFYLEQVDGRKIKNSGMATVGANQSRGFSQTPVVLTHTVSAKPTRFTLYGATMYAAPALAMVNPTCRVQGDVEFTPESGKSYAVHGSLTAQSCSVWIEEEGTARLVTARVSGAGVK